MWNVVSSYGVLHTNNLTQVIMEQYNERETGPSHCTTCRVKGAFENVFYGMCDECNERMFSNNLSGRNKMVEFIQEIQKCIDQAREDYPNDEDGIVHEAIESGHYILNLYTKSFYEKNSQLSVVKCTECSTFVELNTIDKRGYCISCQNPEYDPVWPRGD